MRKRIGYCKLGRSMPLTLEKCGSLGGDIEAVPTLKLLAERHPDVDFVLIGRNSGEDPQRIGLPNNVSNPWILWSPAIRNDLTHLKLNYSNLSIDDHIRVREVLMQHTADTIAGLDGVIMWLGQHGTTNTPLPTIKDRSVLTKPYDWATLYASYLLQGLNLWRDANPHNREEVLLNSDVRNYVKYRDAKWPWKHPVLGQYNQANAVKHEQGDRVTQSTVYTRYARLEISALMPGTPFGDTVQISYDFNRPHDFGIIVNETRREVNPARARVNVLKEWVLPLKPGFIHGKWSDRSLSELQHFAFNNLDGMSIDIKPVPQLEYITKLQTTRTTLTTPASGSGWATAKPWECFAAGVVCFFHPAYDDQDNILGDADPELRRWLRVSTPAELQERIRVTCSSENLWHKIIWMQWSHFNDAFGEGRHLKLIEERLGLL